MFVLGLLAGIGITILALMVIMPRKMFLVNQSQLGFEETAEKIIQSTAENNWRMPNHYDLRVTLKKHGYEVKPVKVFSVCKPELANRILTGSEERIVTALMPCTLAICEAKNGITYVSRLNAGLFSRFLEKNIKNAMVAAGAETEMILESVIKK